VLTSCVRSNPLAARHTSGTLVLGTTRTLSSHPAHAHTAEPAQPSCATAVSLTTTAGSAKRRARPRSTHATTALFIARSRSVRGSYRSTVRTASTVVSVISRLSGSRSSRVARSVALIAAALPPSSPPR